MSAPGGRKALDAGTPSSLEEHGNANAVGLEHDKAACEPVSVLAHELKHPSPDG
jgi:hypothetical protein